MLFLYPNGSTDAGQLVLLAQHDGHVVYEGLEKVHERPVTVVEELVSSD